MVQESLSPKLARGLPWFAAAVLVVGLVIFVIAYSRSESPTTASTPRVTSEKGFIAPNDAPLSREARFVAGKFVLTAVARKDLAYAWKISGPSIRQNLTYKQWLTGDIPVVPFPAQAIDKGLMKIDYSYPNEAQIELALIPRPHSNVESQIFILGLNRIGKGGHRRWVVDYWQPRATPVVMQQK